jgi:D-alanyl-D-alanine dipeptidase
MRVKALISLLAACASPVSGACQQAPPVDHLSAESLLIDVQALDSSIRIDARYATANNFTGAPLPGYAAPRVLLRREVAQALARVQRRLRSGELGLLVFDGYRPVRATIAMVEWAERTGRSDLVKNGYIAARSRHNSGVAIDLTLLDLVTGRPLEMGTAYDTFSKAAHTANAAGQILRNRQILLRAMESEGFTNYSKEWWHFTYSVPGARPFDEVIR